MSSEPHAIVVKARWPNQLPRYVRWTPESAKWLRQCYRHDGIYFVNFRSAQDALGPFIVPES